MAAFRVPAIPGQWLMALHQDINGFGDLILTGVLMLMLSYSCVWGLRKWARYGRLLDIPNERSSHVRPTPRGGGLAIVCLSLAGWTFYVSTHALISTRLILGYATGAILVAGVSWLDDMSSLPVRSRLIAHGAAASLSIIGLGYWHDVALPLVGTLHLGWPGAIATFIWIVGLTNAYNFMDGVDGIAGTQAVTASLGWAVVGALLQQPPVSVLGALLLVTSIGFLGHNWPPARIFMGDVGSAFLGYSFAVLPILCGTNDPGRLPWYGLLVVWPFVFDATLTFIRRLLKGENVFAAHRTHLYQRLVIAGHSHCYVSALYGCLALVGLVLALAWFLDVAGVLTLPALAFLCVSLWVLVTREERKRTIDRANPSPPAVTLQS